MPTAPRFTPDGVRVGSMPVPQVRPQTGIAEGLASVGQSIAGLGQTIERVQARQEQRADSAEREKAKLAYAEKVKADTAAAGGQEGYKKWKQETDILYGKLDIEAQGSQAMPKVSAFQESLAQVDPDKYLPAGYTPEMAAEFQKRVAFETLTYKGASDNMALKRHREYVVNVSKDEVKDSISSASNAMLDDTQEEIYLANIGRAVNAARRAADITGETVNVDDIVGAAAYNALKRVSEITPELAPQKFDEFKKKGRLGSAADNADKLIAPIRKSIALNEKFKEIAFQSTTEQGIFDEAEALKRVDALNLTGEDAENMQVRISKYAAAVDKRREATGDEVLLQLDVEQSKPGFDMEKFMSIPGMAQKVAIMPTKQLVVMRDRQFRGPANSNPVHKEMLVSMVNSATTAAERQEMMNIQRNDLSLSQSDWEWFVKERSKTPDPVDDAVRNRLGDLWTDFGAKKPLPRATRDKDLSDDEAQEVAQFEATRNFVMYRINESKAAQMAIKKGESIKPFVDAAYKEASMPHEVTFEGRKIMATIGTANIYGLPFVVTDDITQRAGNPKRDDPLWRSKIWKAKADMDDEKAAKVMDADLERRMREEKRPVTDAEMKANRERIGSAWRSAKSAGRDAAAAAAGTWMTPGIPGMVPMTWEEETRQKNERDAKPFSQATGPNAAYRDF